MGYTNGKEYLETIGSATIIATIDIDIYGLIEISLLSIYAYATDVEEAALETLLLPLSSKDRTEYEEAM